MSLAPRSSASGDYSALAQFGVDINYSIAGLVMSGSGTVENSIERRSQHMTFEVRCF